MAKTVFICQGCGYRSPKWLGRCPECGEWNSFLEEVAEERREPIPLVKGGEPKRYSEIVDEREQWIKTEISEFDRVLGGGLVPGSLILIGGEPGIGKSTLMLEVAERMSRISPPVLYVSGEESEKQVKLRGERLSLSPGDLYFFAETCLERILEEIERLSPRMVVIDSIQTIFSLRFDSPPGTVSQIREAANRFLLLSKERGISIFLIGHITKEGTIAGPKALEHIVDTVLYFEGERYYAHRLLRAVKNRFGPTNELGIFEMGERGLIPVPKPSEFFLSGRKPDVSGSTILCSIEGSRPLLVEVQALVSAAVFTNPRRMVVGLDPSRVFLILAVLEKRMGFRILANDIYINVVGGVMVTEPAADLAVALALSSSVKNKPLPPDLVCFGEVGLTGEVRGVAQASRRLKEIASLGFSRVVLPQVNLPSAKEGLSKLDLELTGVSTLSQAISLLF
ncbi:MAG: DNA repair protein RadA [Acidobacteria bacterium]|nr:DNA repair protein RadA [Acidobacteriota bacterium]